MTKLLRLFANVNVPANQAQRAKDNSYPCGSIHKVSGDFESRAVVGSWNRILTGAAPGMTSSDSFHSQKNSAHYPVGFDCLEAIFRASRVKTAARTWSTQRHQKGRNR